MIGSVSAASTAGSVRQQGDDVLIDILVQPRASRVRIGPMVGDRLKVAVTAPPVDGKANTAVIQTLCRALAIPRRRVEIASGTSSRRKTVRVTGMARAQVLACIPEAA